jgi:hypothetical protein
VRFRRKKDADAAGTGEPADPHDDTATGDEAVEETRGPSAAGTAGARAVGPWDVAEVDVEQAAESRVDLGSLLVPAAEGLEVQLQVDEASGEVAAVVVAAEDGAMELRAFAAPRNGDIWDDVRRAVAAEVSQLGGTATEAGGAFGQELRVVLTVDLGDGQLATQPSRVVGVSGPRWLLRATFFGRPAVEYDDDGLLERSLREVVVVRGGNPVPPGDALPLRMPPNAPRPGLDGQPRPPA